jgi:transposase
VTALEQQLGKQIDAANRLIAHQVEQLAQQAEQLAQQAEQLAQQAERIEALAVQVETLQEQLRQDSSNSSKPPSSDSPSQREKNRQRRARKASGRKRGGQPKHKGSYRNLVAHEHVDEVVRLFPEQCENCWRELPQTGCAWPKRYQCVELLSGGVQVTEYQRHRVTCPACGHLCWARYGAQIPRRAFGPRLSSIVVMLTGVYHLSRRQTQRLLHEIWQITISLGAMSAIERRMSRLLEPLYHKARELADAAAVKHTDGTGWRQAGKALQLWTVATAAVTVFTIVQDGSAETLRSLFGCLQGILISDRAKAINFWAMKRRQLCWSHLLRKFIAFSERDGPARRFGTDLVAYTAVLFETYRAWRSGLISRRVFRQRMAPVRLQVEALLQRAARAKIDRLSGSCQDILLHKQALWTFVDRRGIEPTNNHAERELRAFVLWRKKSFGTQSDRGNRFAERIMTATHSLRKQRLPVLSTLTRIAQEHRQPALALRAAA